MEAVTGESNLLLGASGRPLQRLFASGSVANASTVAGEVPEVTGRAEGMKLIISA